MNQPTATEPVAAPGNAPAAAAAAAAAATRRWLRPLLAATVLALLGLGGWAAWKTWGGGAAKPDEYLFSSVQRGDIEDLVGATGTLQPRDYVDVGAQVSGQLKRILVEVGSEVKEGQLLAEIDAEQSIARVDANRASLRAQQASLAESELNLVKAERDLQRQQNLMREEATTTEQLQNADTTVRTARTQISAQKAQIEQQQASMRVDEANLKFTKIYAPMAGTVVSVTARQGQTLNANQSAPTILRIADLSVMTVQTQVGEADVSKLRVGMPSYFTTLGSPGRRWPGTLRKLEPTPTVTNNVVLYNALFDVPNPAGTLMTQMTAQVFFVVAEARGVLVVPVAALTMERGSTGARAERGASGGGRGASAAMGAASRPARAASDAAARSDRGERAERTDRAERPARQAGGPRRATVKVAAADGSISTREVTVGVSSRVSAEILSGLNEGDRVVVGLKVPAVPVRAAGQGTSPGGLGGMGAPGGVGGGGGAPGGGQGGRR